VIQARGDTWRILWLGLGFLALGLGCGEPDPPQPMSCSSASQCPSRYHCSPQGVCTADVLCQSDGDCCLAERCEAGLCRTRQACSEAAQCLDPATECRFGICAPRPCDATLPCAAGLGCVAGICVAKAPCGGSCPAGLACAPRIDRCVAAPSVACMPGQLAYFTNEIELMPEGCAAVPPKLGCAALPPLVAGDRAPPGVLLSKGSELLHLAYDRTYGDAVLARYGNSPPFPLKSLQIISGLPEGAPVVAAVDGSRQRARRSGGRGRSPARGPARRQRRRPALRPPGKRWKPHRLFSCSGPWPGNSRGADPKPDRAADHRGILTGRSYGLATAGCAIDRLPRQNIPPPYVK
jgi:hypothetical protein